MKAWIAAIAMVEALACSPAFAETVTETTGNELLVNCKKVVRYADGDQQPASQIDAMHFQACISLIEGIKATMMIYNSVLPHTYQLCWPERGINNGQGARIVVRYLEQHPADLNLNQSLLTMLAFKDAYPCK